MRFCRNKRQIRADMKKPFFPNALKTKVQALAILAGACLTAHSDDHVDVYDNTANPTGTYYASENGVEVGDQVNFDTSKGPVVVTQFAFETFGENLVDNGTSASIRFYVASPESTEVGELQIQSLPITISNGAQVHTIAGLEWDTSLYNSMIWTVTFAGIPEDGSAGLTLSTPPVIGSSYGDFFENENPGSADSFEVKLFTSEEDANFTAIAEGTMSVIPEPTSLALMAIGGLAFMRYRRK